MKGAITPSAAVLLCLFSVSDSFTLNSASTRRATITTTSPSHEVSWSYRTTALQADATTTNAVKESEKEAAPIIFPLKSVEQLDKYFDESTDLFRKPDGTIDYKARLTAASVEGDTQIIGSPEHKDKVHPVVQLLHQRRKTKTTQDDDGFKVALSVEGGGMRGCLSAGMVAAIYYLGLEDTVNVVYGSSAGGVIGSYFVTRQLQWFGPEIYYDCLTTAGKEFINKKGLLRALGIGAVNPLLWNDYVMNPRFGKPVLNLDFLLTRTMQETKPLDWETFAKRQSTQPIKIVASNMRDEEAIVLDMENGGFSSLPELAQCLHASCLLPGIAGPVMNRHVTSGEMKVHNHNGKKHEDMLPLADALLYEPMPFKSAIKEGATHVICLRTRPDGTDVTGKSSLLEGLLLKRFFRRKNKLPKIFDYMKKGLHKVLYGKDVLILNDYAQDMDRDYTSTTKPHVMTIAVPPGSPEVTRLETRRHAIFDGVRRGFARAYDALVEDPNERGRGWEIAQEYFPDEILQYDPVVLALEEEATTTESAFKLHLEKQGENPEEWKAKAPYMANVER